MRQFAAFSTAKYVYKIGVNNPMLPMSEGLVVRERAETTASGSATPNEMSHVTQPTLLLVDDSNEFRERLGRAFEERGYEVRTAANYDDAIAATKDWIPNRAVVDLRMPGHSGLDLVRDLKQLDESIEVLLLTGYGSIPTTVDAMRLGAINVLTKPADADDILASFERGEADVDAPPATAHEVPSLAQAEWEHIHRVLSDCGGNISEAARRLGMHRRSLQRKLRKRAPD